MVDHQRSFHCLFFFLDVHQAMYRDLLNKLQCTIQFRPIPMIFESWYMLIQFHIIFKAICPRMTSPPSNLLDVNPSATMIHLCTCEVRYFFMKIQISISQDISILWCDSSWIKNSTFWNHCLLWLLNHKSSSLLELSYWHNYK